MPGAARIEVTGRVPTPAHGVKLARSAMLGLAKRLSVKAKMNLDRSFDFGGHQNHGGLPWAALRQSTIAIKSALGYPRPAAPLVRTGSMSKSVLARIEIVPYAGGLQWYLAIDNAAPYAKYHQTGFRNHWTGRMVVARRPSVVTKQDLQYIRASIESAMMPSSKGKMVKKPSRIRQIGNKVLGFLLRRGR